MATSGDRIVVECDDLTSTCPDLTGPFSFPVANSNGDLPTDIELVADPPRKIRMVPGSSGTALIDFGPAASGWTLDGFDIDGNGANISALVTVRADGVTIRNSHVHNVVGDLIRVDRFDTCSGVECNYVDIHRFHLENSEVSDCVAESGGNPTRAQDCHGVMSVNGQNMAIVGNHFHHLFADGIQLQSQNNADPNKSPHGPGDWFDIDILDNVFETSPRPFNFGSTQSTFRPGENAVDLKGGKGNVRIVGNVIRGFRGFKDGEPTSGGSGSGSAGEGIVIHGDMTACGKGAAEPCVLIEANDIADCNGGVTVQSDVATGVPHDVHIRRNVIHDLASLGSPKPTREERGPGLRIGDIDGVLVEHNTIVNTAGPGIYQEGDCANCTFQFNLLSHAGPACGSNTGRSARFTQNVCYDVGDSNQSTHPECGAWTSSAPVFSLSKPQPPSCGTAWEPSLLALEDIAPGDVDFDYALSLNAPNAGIVDAAISSTATPFCDNASDVGAKERCINANGNGHDAEVKDIPGGFRVTVDATDYYRMTAQFAAGIGAFGNAVSYPTAGTTSCMGISKLGCVEFTRDCLAECNPPTLPTGEINCSCMEGSTRDWGVKAPGLGVNFEGVLATDTDADGRIDRELNDEAAATLFRMTSFQTKVGWEDFDFPKENGDRDDFTHNVNVLACTTGGLKDTRVQSDAEDDLAPSVCFERPDKPDDFRVTARIGIDKAIGDDGGLQLREGRTLQLEVTVYNFSVTRDQYVALCPTMVLNPYDTISYADQALFSGSTCGGPSSSPGVPVCGGDKIEGIKTVALAQYQQYRQGCSVPPADDAFYLPRAQPCGNAVLPSTATLNFEVKLDELDQLYSGASPTHPPSQTRVSDFARDFVQSLELNLITDLTTRRLACPSGFNLKLTDVDPSTGRLMRFTSDMGHLVVNSR